MKYLLTILLITFILNLKAQQPIEISKKKDTIENFEIQTRFFGIDYEITFPQRPYSYEYNLEGITTNFTSFNIDIAYAWILGKNNTVLLPKIGYSNFKAKVKFEENEEDRIKLDVPNYFYTIPAIHNFDFDLILYQKLKYNFDFITNYNLNISSDFKNRINKDNYNSIILFYLQKKIRKISVGAGSVVYVIDKKVKIIPLLSLSFENKKMKTELLFPTNFSVIFKFKNQSIIKLNSDLIISGFKVNYSSNFPNQTPDYISKTGFDFALGYDKQFLSNLHWSIALGYSYRDFIYEVDKVLIDKQIFKSGLFLLTSFYIGF